MGINPQKVEETRKEILQKRNEVTTKKKIIGYSADNYINITLENDEETRKIQVRPLPVNKDSEDIADIVYFHGMKTKYGYKEYACLSRNKFLHDKFGSECPICLLSKKASENEKIERGLGNIEKAEKFKQIAFQNTASQRYIFRFIERGKESVGPKFLKTNFSKKGKDLYSDIMSLYDSRRDESDNKDYNMFSEINGKDLYLTVSKVKNAKGSMIPSITSVNDAGRETPLCSDKELGESWVNDEKTWQDVFPPKPYEWLAITAKGQTPVFDKEKNIFISKEEADKESENVKFEPEANTVGNSEDLPF